VSEGRTSCARSGRRADCTFEQTNELFGGCLLNEKEVLAAETDDEGNSRTSVQPAAPTGRRCPKCAWKRSGLYSQQRPPQTRASPEAGQTDPAAPVAESVGEEAGRGDGCSEVPERGWLQAQTAVPLSRAVSSKRTLSDK